MSLLDCLSVKDYNDVVKDGVVDYIKLIEDYLPLKDFDQFKQLNNNYLKQCVVLPNSIEPGYSSIYRNSLSKDNLITKIIPELDTVLKHFEKVVEVKPDSNCLGTRLKKDDFFTFKSYKEIQLIKNQFGSGLRNLLNTIDNKDEIVSIFSPNRIEWVVSSLACQSFNLTSTALYDTLGPKTSKFILNFTKSPILITTIDNLPKILNILNNSRENLPFLEFIILMDGLKFEDYGLIKIFEAFNIKLLDFNQVLSIGKLNPIDLNPAKFDSVLSISFTSGTTGNPKGVLITHQMCVATMTFSFSQIGIDKDKNSIRYFSFLPLAHIYEMLNIYGNISRGFEIAFPPDPSPLTLVENLRIYKPHFVTLVPRVYTKIEGAIKSGLSSGFIGKNIISKLISYKEEEISKTNESAIDISKSIYSIDHLIIKKLRNLIGFNDLKLCISGSAPIAKETIQFIKSAFNVEFLQGYGLTESCSGISIELPNQNDQTCGLISIGIEIKLKDLPEMNHLTHDSNGKELMEPSGELLLRGDQIFKNYFNDLNETNKVLNNGWFSTGDVAKIDKFGRILIIDRVKNFFKLSQGEYITPERIENIYLSKISKLMTQLFIYGNSNKNYLVSIVGVDPVQLRVTLDLFKFDYKNLNEFQILNKINNSRELKLKFLKYINYQIKDENLQGFEKIHNFKFFIEPLKVNDGTITPTFKIKRNNATNFFRDELDKLYEEGSLLRERL